MAGHRGFEPLIFAVTGRRVHLTTPMSRMAGVVGIEPTTSCLTGKRCCQLSYTPVFFMAGTRRFELLPAGPKPAVLPLHHAPWSGRKELNLTSVAYKATALPLSYTPVSSCCICCCICIMCSSYLSNSLQSSANLQY